MPGSSGADASARLPLSPYVYELAAAKLVLHLATARGYGWFRDEFYYIACSEHLAFGYVDHPPLIAVLTALSRAIGGDSIVALRALPAVAGALTVWMAGVLARELGARPFGQALACVALLAAPMFVALHHFVSMNAYEPLVWTAFAWLLVRGLRDNRTADWVWAGVVAGVGLQNKHSMLFLGFAVAVGLVLSPARRVLLTRGPWIAAAVAGLLFLPNVAWQVQHGWPTLEFMANARRGKMAELPIAAFLREQVLTMNPVSLPVWLAGLWMAARIPFARPLAWAFVALLVVFAGTGAKPYYLAPYYPILFASGGMAVEHWLRGRLARGAALVALVLSGAALAPLALPLLPVESFVAYSRMIGVTPESGERHRQGRLPQLFADMFGWEELVAEVDRVAASLPPSERERVVVYARNYGEAGAINFLGRPRGTPPAVSGHNNYWLWGPGRATREVLIVLGGDAADHRECTTLALAGRVQCGDCMPYQDDLPVWICRDLRGTIADVWAGAKHYQ